MDRMTIRSAFFLKKKWIAIYKFNIEINNFIYSK